MEGGSCTVSTILMALVAILFISTNMNIGSDASSSKTTVNEQFIQTSCQSTTYQKICLSSLFPYANKIKARPKKLAHTALSVSLKNIKSTSRLVKKLSKQHGLKPNEAAALKDCVENISDSIYEIRLSVSEMKKLNGTDFESKMSDIKTWVSAALTNDDTCLDELDEEAMNKEMKDLIGNNITNVAHHMSNALVFINSLNYTQLISN